MSCKNELCIIGPFILFKKFYLIKQTTTALGGQREKFPEKKAIEPITQNSCDSSAKPVYVFDIVVVLFEKHSFHVTTHIKRKIEFMVINRK